MYSVTRDAGHESEDAPRERTSNAGHSENKRRRQKGGNRDETTPPRFCTTFADVEAWPSDNHGSATEGDERW